MNFLKTVVAITKHLTAPPQCLCTTNTVFMPLFKLHVFHRPCTSEFLFLFAHSMCKKKCGRIKRWENLWR